MNRLLSYSNPYNHGGGTEYLNMTGQLWNANRGAGPLSFANQDRLHPRAQDERRPQVDLPGNAEPTTHTL